MLRVCSLLLVACCVCPARVPPDAEDPISVVRELFDAMMAHDAERAAALFVPQAMLFNVKPDGTPTVMPYSDWVKHFGASKDTWLERIRNPKLLERGTVAAVWTEYDFYLNGKLRHCGIDSFNLLKTSRGWRIAAISDTRETSGCVAHPPGSDSN
jgi:hypothetical protein